MKKSVKLFGCMVAFVLFALSSLSFFSLSNYSRTVL